MKTVFVILLTACLLAPSRAAEPDASTAKPKQVKPATVRPAGAVKPGAAVRPLRAKPPLRTEAELSGFSSETTDQFHGRLNLGKATARHRWWIKTDYGFTRSRTYGKTKITESDVSGYNLDAAYRRNGRNTYSFVAIVAGLKKRTPHTANYWDQSDFRMLSVGYGKTILRGLEFETSLAQITRQKGAADDRITPLYTLRMKTPLNPSVTVDADLHLVQPWSADSLVDSRTNLTYRLTPTLSMRLSYVANNILGTTLTKREWDKSFRVSLVFAR